MRRKFGWAAPRSWQRVRSNRRGRSWLIDGRLLPDRSELVAQDVDFAERRVCCQKRIKIDLLLGLQGALPGKVVVALALDEELVLLLCIVPCLSADGSNCRVVVGDDVELVEDDISVRQVFANDVAEMPDSIVSVHRTRVA